MTQLRLELAEAFRFGPVALSAFGAGLLLLAAAGATLFGAVRHDGHLARVGAGLVMTGLALFLPQFFTPAPARIAHGVLLGAGCVVLAARTSRRGAPVQLPSALVTASN